MTISAIRLRPGPGACTQLKDRVFALKAGDIMAPITVIMPSNYSGLWKRRELAQTGYANVRFIVVDRLLETLGTPVLTEQRLRPLNTVTMNALTRESIRRSGAHFGSASQHPERGGQATLWHRPPEVELAKYACAVRKLNLEEERSPYEVEQKAASYAAFRGGHGWWRDKIACDLWTAAFFLPLHSEHEVPTTDTVRNYLRNAGAGSGQMVGQAADLSAKHPFFHWPLEFPDVFDRGGFDVVLGNPPWERVKLQEQEFFAGRDRWVAEAGNAAVRKRRIADLKENNPTLDAEFRMALHLSEAQSKFLRRSERFTLTGKGDVNLYSVFGELDRRLLGKSARAGVVLPTGVATDDTNKEFFGSLVSNGALASLYDFENRKKLFPAVDSRMKFSLITMTSDFASPAKADFACFLLDTEELSEEERHFDLSPEEFALINPNTLTLPIFRSKRDAELTKAIYRRVPILIRDGPPEENPWGIRFMRMFDMSNDSGLFRTRSELEADGWQLEGNIFHRGGQRYLPLYEAKMLHQFDHRWATYDGLEVRDMTVAEKQDPDCVALPRYWVPEVEVDKRLVLGHSLT